jgi:hypothetical protein
MRWHATLLAASFLVGCFVDEETGDTDAAIVGTCRECQDSRCAAYRDACNADPECMDCVAAPYGLACLANANMHALGSCSCSECPNECDHLCPGPPGTCDTCSFDQCAAPNMACIEDTACAPCIEDPFREGCAENALHTMARACTCMNCGQACIWECSEAGNTCAGCLSVDCAEPFGQCMQDETCIDCFAAPYKSECADSMPYQTLQMCICGQCSADCGVLFDCGV